MKKKNLYGCAESDKIIIESSLFSFMNHYNPFLSDEFPKHIDTISMG